MKLYFEAFGKKPRNNISLASTTKKDKEKRFLPYVQKSISRSRQDIKNWNDDLNTYNSADSPKTYPLQLLFNEIMIDAHLTSQIENRKQQVFSAEFSLKNEAGEVDDDQTAILKNLTIFRLVTNQMLDSIYFGYSVFEWSIEKTDTGQKINITPIPRTNFVPRLGLFYPDYSEDKSISYRDLPEYGTWILEFDTGDIGLLNKAVPHVLFKRFAESCWAELCEIYGIPPRVLKTNTQDQTLLNRAEQMMKDMGAASWFIIDETEEFEWAKGVDTNGDVYKNLMTVTRDEISLLISGAVIGQDTVNGNRSKDESAQEMLWQLVQSDMSLCEDHWNNIVLPALVKMGVLKPGLHFEFEQAEDLDQLFKFTTGLLPFKDVDNDWLKNTFGVEVIGDRSIQPGNNSLKFDSDFFV